jgi:hypothetical protein
MVSGGAQSAGSGGAATTGVGFDGIVAEQEEGVINGPAGNSYAGSVGISGVKIGLSEGLHFATILAASTAGTATWYGGAASASVQPVSVTIALQG